MAHSSWGPGWPNCPTEEVVTVVTKSGVRLPVREEISFLTAGLVTDLERARGKQFNPDWCWGGACRSISGTRIPSNHSWWLAVDLDAPENPYMSADAHNDPHPLRVWIPNQNRHLRMTMPLNAAAIAAKWGFYWGGLYSSKPDPMHFEFIGSVADAERLTAKLGGDNVPLTKKDLNRIKRVVRDEVERLAVGTSPDQKGWNPRRINLKDAEQRIKDKIK